MSKNIDSKTPDRAHQADAPSCKNGPETYLTKSEQLKLNTSKTTTINSVRNFSSRNDNKITAGPEEPCELDLCGKARRYACVASLDD